MRSLEEIKRLRKKHNLNQKQLADKSGVSQSLIAKIEAGKVEPTFSKAQKIFQALDTLRERDETKAEEIMNKHVLFMDINDPITKVISVMKKKGISQIPILAKERVSGIITERTILMADKIQSLKAGDIMEDAPPIISVKTGIRTISELLRDHAIVLAAKRGNIKGVITKSDVLGVE